MMPEWNELNCSEYANAVAMIYSSITDDQENLLCPSHDIKTPPT